jgi:hypothetical protein
MNVIDVKKEVEQAVGTEWSAFAARHPHLAAALDQQLLVEQAMASLADDPDYRAAMDQGAAVAGTAGSIGSVVKRLVGEFFGKAGV